MKKTVVSAFAALILFGAAAAANAQSPPAKKFEFDASFAFASGPDAFNNGIGLNFGLGYMLTKLVKNLQARIDAGHYHFERDDAGNRLTYRRTMYSISARYYFLLLEQLRMFGQLGTETSWDYHEYMEGTSKRTKEQLHMGIVPCAGIEYNLSPTLSVFALFRHHWIADSYSSLHFGAAMHF